MPTLEEWEQALAAPRRVRVESSTTLLQQVRQRRAREDAKRQRKGQSLEPRKDNLTVVGTFAPALNVQITPVYLLHRLGVVTTPQIPNLADICSTWAYFRYLWAFEIPAPGTVNPVLRLSDAARSIDFHQKCLLSDQIGVGMAATLLGDHLNAPLAVDVSVAIGGNWPVELQYESSPDYLFFDANQANLFVVECKGTQSSRSSSLDQLRRGLEQVPSLRFTDGRTPPSVVVATCMSKDDTSVLLLDPPGEKDPPKFPERSERLDERRWRIKNDEEFSKATRLLAEAKILSFAGADQAASQKLERTRTPLSKTPRSAPRPLETLENEFGVFRGVRQRVGVKDRVNLDIFQALDTAVYDAFVSEETARVDEELRTFRARTKVASTAEPQSPQAVFSTRQNNALVVRSAAPDGSLLEVRVSPA